MIKTLLYMFFLFVAFDASALSVKHDIQTTVGGFNISNEKFAYTFYDDKSYEMKTAIQTVGTFDTLYPFFASYRSWGTYNKDGFVPQDYFYETQSRFLYRTKEIVYKDGIPQYRISKKGEKIRQDEIETESKYKTSNDLLTTFGELINKIVNSENCDFEQYSFNGKRYSRSTVKTVGKEKMTTPYFSGNALKCVYYLEVLDDADAGFFLKKNEPIYFWALRDEKYKVWFLARILVESTPFGAMESLTTKIEVTP